MRFVIYLIAVFVALALVTKLENIGAHQKLGRMWQLILGIAIGIGVYCIAQAIINSFGF